MQGQLRGKGNREKLVKYSVPARIPFGSPFSVGHRIDCGNGILEGQGVQSCSLHRRARHGQQCSAASRRTGNGRATAAHEPHGPVSLLKEQIVYEFSQSDTNYRHYHCLG